MCACAHVYQHHALVLCDLLLYLIIIYASMIIMSNFYFGLFVFKPYLVFSEKDFYEY